MLGLLCLLAGAVRQHDRGHSWWMAIIRAGIHAAVMALPIALILLWRSDATGGITDRWFGGEYRWEYLQRMFRDRWEPFDLASAAIVLAVPLFALVHPRLTLSRNLAFSGLILAATYVLLPRIVFGSAYADMRLVPFAAAMFVLAVRFKAETRFPLATWLAIAAVGFMIVRLTGTAVSMAMAGRKQAEQLEALDHIEAGSRVAVLVWDKCEQWSLRRSDHLGAIATVRKEAYTNDHWPMAGSALMRVRYPQAGWFQRDPSQIVRDPGCRHEGWAVRAALANLPREAFDYLWLVDMRPIPRSWASDWRPIWATRDSILLKKIPITEIDEEQRQATRRTASGSAR